MVEMRFYVEKWTEYDEHGAIPHIEEPVLQYRQSVELNSAGECVIATEWQDVPTVTEEV